MSDMQCPYCGADQEVCHDDGAGYSEDERHALYTEQQVRALLAGVFAAATQGDECTK